MPERSIENGAAQYKFEFWEFEKIYRAKVVQFDDGTVISLVDFTIVCPQNNVEYFEHLLEEQGLAVTAVNRG